MKAIKKYKVYDASKPQWVDPQTPEGKRKLERTVGLRWQHDTAADGSKLSTLIAEGNKQPKETYGSDISAPTLSMKLLRTIISYAVYYQMQFHKVEVKHAFMYADLDTELYVNPPPKDPILADNRIKLGLTPIYKLNKAMQGLKQSHVRWYEHLRKFMVAIGFKTSPDAPAVFVANVNFIFNTIIVGVFGDELFVVTLHPESYTWFQTQLNRYFEIKEFYRPKKFMGLDISYEKESVKISKKTQIEKLIKKYSLDPKAGGKLDSPIPAKFDWSRFDDKENLIAKMSDDDLAEGKKWMNLRMGALNDLANTCREDISKYVAKLSQFQDYPHLLIQRLVQRVLLYVAQTPDKGVLYNRALLHPTIINCWTGRFAPAQCSILKYFIYTTGNITWGSREIKSSATEMDDRFTILFKAMDEIYWIRRVWLFLKRGRDDKDLLTDEVAVLIDDEDMFDHFVNNDYKLSSNELMDKFRPAQKLLTSHKWMFGPIDPNPVWMAEEELKDKLVI